MTNPEPHTKAVAQVLNESCGHMTERDFLDLALAALDQGGASVNLCGRIKTMLENAGLMNEASDG